jgi:hypothetical protein
MRAVQVSSHAPPRKADVLHGSALAQFSERNPEEPSAYQAS